MEWCTASENNKHAWNTGLKVVTEKRREICRELGKKGTKTVLQYDLQGNFIKEWESGTEVARQLNINQRNISACCLRKKKTAGGYIWRYKEEEL